MTTLLEAADTLYGLPLPEFTPARDALAKELRATDRPLADLVKALKKPSTSAWVVNLLVRRDPDQVDQVLVVGAALREAQASLDASELRALTRQRRQLTSAITQQARALAVEHGQKVTGSVADQVEATLTAAMVDEAAGAAVRTGLLVNAMTSTGIEAVDAAAYVAVPDAAGFAPSQIEAPASHPPELHIVPDPDEQAKRLDSARQQLAEAEREADAANEALTAAADEVAELEARSLQMQAEIDELRRRLAEHEEEQDQIDDQLGDAQQVVESARDDVREADLARQRAAAKVERLER
ncbi:MULTISPECIES: hypothetical protein [unclassified Nocardioides]|uniref:hypothetical protein n=1 Tax=unclassified Nocardioides TaxID=2615069 RepID=UPI0006FD85AA|nr:MULTISPECIES: hypothetical protein [unclassified Nocardioides]KQY63938.1 hypothetical protein ASD30_02865 [Nocardioides sp. Root140]KQZ69856.1 hypothetical protein ASD66_09110 [Nocardioides sp. Root151]KRF15952.1 hypothetical protein ASH02_04870 [Nocardioides sp. Soil796]